jgi:hypothetical protein
VVLADIDMPFWRMVAVILKFMIASIPAAILFYLLAIGVSILCLIAFGGLGVLLTGGGG